MLDVQKNYVVLTGGEGSGKTTVVERLIQDFPTATFTREPGGTPMGQTFRALLLENNDATEDPWVQFHLFMADRQLLARRVIRPAVEQGRLIVSDRGMEGTFAYQCFAGLKMPSAKWYLEYIARVKLPVPGVWIWLDLEPSIGLERRQQAGGVNRFDAKNTDFHLRVREGMHIFFQEAKKHTRIERLDATQSPDDVYAQVIAIIRSIATPEV